MEGLSFPPSKHHLPKKGLDVHGTGCSRSCSILLYHSFYQQDEAAVMIEDSNNSNNHFDGSEHAEFKEVQLVELQQGPQQQQLPLAPPVTERTTTQATTTTTTTPHVRRHSVDAVPFQNEYEDYLHPIFPSLSWASRSPTSLEQQRRHILLTTAHDPSILIPPLSMTSPSRRLRGLSPTKFLLQEEEEVDEDDEDDQDDDQWRDHPDFGHLRWLLAALMLTTTLACISAWDAKAQCISTEVYALSELLDDDSLDLHQLVLEDESYTCIEMFRWVMLPVGVVTVTLGSFGFFLLSWNLKPKPEQFNDLLSKSVSLLKKRQEQDFTRSYQKCLVLLTFFVVILGVWTYGIIAIMLRPRYNVKVGEDNPYQSLAAVDAKGHVGDNANLYYLSWISQGLGVALLYQVSVDAYRLYQQRRLSQRSVMPPRAMAVVAAGIPPTASSTATTTKTGGRLAQERPHLHQSSGGGDVEATLSYTSSQLKIRRQQRLTWYHFLYRLRLRSGIWVAALISTTVLFVSAAQYWNWVLVRKATRVIGYAPDNLDVCTVLHGSSNQQRDVELCYRTSFGIVSGCIGTMMCGAAVVLHILARQTILEEQVCWTFPIHGVGIPPTNGHGNISLQSELVLSFVLSLLLGTNAVVCTGVRGPAAAVGNLYYASWLSFLLCLRNCLGCLEEFLNIDDNQHQQHELNSSITTLVDGADPEQQQRPNNSLFREPSSVSCSTSASRHSLPTQKRAHFEMDGAEVSNTGSLQDKKEGKTVLKSNDSVSTGNSSQLSNTDPLEKERSKRLRSYFFLGIFSIVCAASALDAAYNQGKKLTPIQWYMMSAPSLVVLVCTVQFVLCLRQRSYPWVAHFCCGGLLSIVTFLIWLANLVMTMHSEESWAVNEIGNIRMANLYYFTWAAVITAGLQMASFVKAILPWQEEDYMAIVWAAICKVCFVILGASLHIWLTISSNCTLDEIQLGAVTFCSRTILAISVALAGMVVGGCVVVGRILLGSRWFANFLTCNKDGSSPPLLSSRLRAHVEAVISVFLVFLFGAAVALVTGIGGPGQSVGDLYYSTWLAFWVSIGIFVTCYEQIQWEDMVLQVEKYQQQQQRQQQQKREENIVDGNNNYYRNLSTIMSDEGEPVSPTTGVIV